MREVIDCHMQISSLNYGDYVSDGVECCHIAMVEIELFGQHLTVAWTQPVHSYIMKGDIILQIEGDLSLEPHPLIHPVLLYSGPSL